MSLGHTELKSEGHLNLFLVEDQCKADDGPEFRVYRRFLHRTGRIPPAPSTLLLETPARDSLDHPIAWECLHGDSACRRAGIERVCGIPWDLCWDRHGQSGLPEFRALHTMEVCWLQRPGILRQICCADCRQGPVVMMLQP